jgi:environmental stress-induced protein Ves
VDGLKSASCDGAQFSTCCALLQFFLTQDHRGMHVVRKASFTATPWKNGGGITHEAIRVPAGGDPFRWRLSVAQIEASGPFSDFSAYNRTTVLLRGAGMRLNFANGERAHLREVGDVVEFDGALATQCELLAGACVDLNLIVAKSMVKVGVRVERLPAALALGAARNESTLVFCIDGTVAVGSDSGESAVLEQWDLAVVSHAAGGVIKPMPQYPATTQAPAAPGVPPLVFLATLNDT